jgi:uncharacterized membrane protein YqhA
MIKTDKAGANRELRGRMEPLGRVIGRTRYVVLLAVIAVLLVALSLFLLGTILAFMGIWEAWAALFHGRIEATDLTVEFLEIVSVMLKAVFFYLIGVGLYSLFIAPLNIATSLGVETLNDLETKVISVVVVILAVSFLEEFISGKQALEILQYGGALAVAVAALVLFQFYNHRAKEDQQVHGTTEQSKEDLFEHDEEHDQSTPDKKSDEQDRRVR